jgi:hypothetical protein
MTEAQELLEELKIWLAAERAAPDTILENDPLLLDRVTCCLSEMRIEILTNNDVKLFEEYKSVYSTLCDVLQTRINKVKGL